MFRDASVVNGPASIKLSSIPTCAKTCSSSFASKVFYFNKAVKYDLISHLKLFTTILHPKSSHKNRTFSF